MDLPEIVKVLVEQWGPVGLVVGTLLAINVVLARKYDSVMQSRVDEGVKMALALQQLTQTIEALRELIKERRP